MSMLTKQHILTKMMKITCNFSTSFFSYKPFSSSSSSSSLLSFKPSHTFSPSSSINNHTLPSFSTSATNGSTCTLTWDHVFHVSQSEVGVEEHDPCSYLQGYFHKVQLCNRGSVSSYLNYLSFVSVFGSALTNICFDRIDLNVKLFMFGY